MEELRASASGRVVLPVRALAVLLVCGCSVNVQLEGKLCADAEPRCLPGYVCIAGVCARGAADGGEPGADAGCPAEPDPAASQCPGHTYYLSASGSDAEDGGSPATARRTLTGVALQPGDVVQLLGGSYAQSPRLGSAAGTRTCPLVVRGEPDGGTVLTQSFSIGNSHTVVRWLTFSPLNDNAVELGSADRVTFQFVKFAVRRTTGFPTMLHVNQTCTDCTIRDSVFEGADGVSVGYGGGQLPRFRLRDNVFHVRHGEGLHLEGPGIVVSGNDFSGEYSLDDGVLDAAPDVLITRNVFHDLKAQFGDKTLLYGGVYTHNTFARIRDNTAPLLRDAGFQSNLVVEADHVVEGPSGGYNVFDPTVDEPFIGAAGVSGTDRVADVLFDGTGWTPRDPSAALDSANPADPVPPGGGSRADVGAVERGAAGYCLPDGGAL